MTQSKKRFLLILLMAVVTLIIVVGMNWSSLMREYRFWQDFEFIELNEQGYKEYLHRKSGIVMVLLPGGEFMMGSPEDELGRSEDEYLHKVRLSPFLIAKYEVSHNLWKEVMGNNPSQFPDAIRDELPVENVSWDNCFGSEDSFCNKMGLVLPTEAQWEYSAKAKNKNLDSLAMEIICEYPSSFSSIVAYTSSIGFIPGTVNSNTANSYGLYNMQRNVGEWCADSYDQDFYLSPESKNGDYPFVSEKGRKVVRGISWNRGRKRKICRTAKRSSMRRNSSKHSIGFRPVYNLTK